MAFYVPWLVDAARTATQGTGRQVIVDAGWQSRGHGGLRVLEIVVGHHTGTPESSPGDYPSHGVVRDGRSDLPGPLAQLGLGRSGNVYVIAAGLAYHAGASAYAGYVDLNDESIGIEAEDSGDGIWTPDQLLMYPRLVAACLLYMRRGVDRYASHRTVATPAGRKVDPTGISDEWMRQQAQTTLNEGFDVGLTTEEHEWLKQIYDAMGSVFVYSGGTSIAWVFQQQYDHFKIGGYRDQDKAEIAELQGQVADLKAEMDRLTGEVSNIDVTMVPDPVQITLRTAPADQARAIEKGS